MATLTPRKGTFTYDDFCALIRDDQKADLIDGVIYNSVARESPRQ